MSKKDFDLILMDLQMPIMDGFEAARKILEFKDDQKIVALTADALNQVKEDIRNCGMIDSVSKPIDVSHLFEVIAENLKLEIYEEKAFEFNDNNPFAVPLESLDVKQGLGTSEWQ